MADPVLASAIPKDDPDGVPNIEPFPPIWDPNGDGELPMKMVPDESVF